MALELGASRCLRKPFTPVALLAVINDCLADARASAPGAAHDAATAGRAVNDG
jgi:DNA-binding response OmpR family regulator